MHKKALYMGYANIPMALGWGYGSFAGGQIYERAGEKAGLALHYMSEVLVNKLPASNTKLKTQVNNNFWDHRGARYACQGVTTHPPATYEPLVLP